MYTKQTNKQNVCEREKEEEKERKRERIPYYLLISYFTYRPK